MDSKGLQHWSLWATPVGPGRSGFSLRRTGMVAMLHGLRGRKEKATCSSRGFRPRIRPERVWGELRPLFVPTAARGWPTTGTGPQSSELVTVLREQLAEEREARRRADTIIAQLTQANATLAARIPELEAPSEPREPPESTSEPSETTEPQSDTEGQQEPSSQAQASAQARSWWRRMFGR